MEDWTKALDNRNSIDNILPVIPYDVSLDVSLSCGTESKAF